MRLAADANVLLSALIGGRAQLVLAHPRVREVMTVPAVMDEIGEYLPLLARKRGLDVTTLLLALAALPVTVVPADAYGACLEEAEQRMGGRDPDDVPLLAMSLHERVPIWTNDRDFEGMGIECFTTAEILKRLGH